MVRKTKSRLQLRKDAEAVESQETTKKVAKKKATRKKATKRAKSVKTPDRKRLVWVIFSGSMKEEARFPYDQRAAAETKLEQLLAKGKRLYFMQPVKETITAPVAAETE